MRSRKRRGTRKAKFIPKIVVRSEENILVGKVGELKCNSDAANDIHDVANNELNIENKKFVIRDELNALQLKYGELTALIAKQLLLGQL